MARQTGPTRSSSGPQILRVRAMKSNRDDIVVTINVTDVNEAPKMNGGMRPMLAVYEIKQHRQGLRLRQVRWTRLHD